MRIDHQVAVETVVPGLDRRMRGENALFLGLGHGLGAEIRPAASFSRINSSVKKAAWPSFMWKTEGCTPKRAQQAHAADAQQHFLHDAHGVVAAINPARQIAEVLGVLRAICVQKIDGISADVDPPGLEINIRHFDFHRANHRLALGVEHRFQRQIFRA